MSEHIDEIDVHVMFLEKELLELTNDVAVLSTKIEDLVEEIRKKKQKNRLTFPFGMIC